MNKETPSVITFTEQQSWQTHKLELCSDRSGSLASQLSVWNHQSRHAVTSLYFVDNVHVLGVLFFFFLYKKKLLCCDLLICPDCHSHLSVCLPCLQFSARPFATLCSLIRASSKKICQKNPIWVSYMCFLSEHSLQSKDKWNPPNETACKSNHSWKWWFI